MKSARIIENEENKKFISKFVQEQYFLLNKFENQTIKTEKFKIIGKMYENINTKIEHLNKVCNKTSANKYTIVTYNKCIEFLDALKNYNHLNEPILLESVTKILLKSRKLLYREILKIKNFDSLPTILKPKNNYNLRKK